MKAELNVHKAKLNVHKAKLNVHKAELNVHKAELHVHKAIVFAYHNMGITGLNALEKAGFEIPLIFSHEDDPNENCWYDSVREWGEKRGIRVACPTDIRAGKWVQLIAGIAPEMLFSFYFRLMIPDEILAIPPLGAYNLHGSLLPAYRGRAPVNWVLVNGEKETGVTLHHIVRKPDAGDIVGQRAVPIAFEDTALTLFGKLCDAAGALLDDLLPLIKEGRAPRAVQDLSAGSYFGGRCPEDGRIDWGWPAMRIYNLIRAVTDPYPGAFCDMADGRRLMVWRALPDAAPAKDHGATHPGIVEIHDRKVSVRTGEGSITLLEIQCGAERMTGDGIYNFFKNKEGMKIE